MLFVNVENLDLTYCILNSWLLREGSTVKSLKRLYSFCIHSVHKLELLTFRCTRISFYSVFKVFSL